MEEGRAGRKRACLKCRHYMITWEPGRPYGCRAHGFKSHRTPSVVVYESSGMECQMFESRIRPNDE